MNKTSELVNRFTAAAARYEAVLKNVEAAGAKFTADVKNGRLSSSSRQISFQGSACAIAAGGA